MKKWYIFHWGSSNCVEYWEGDIPFQCEDIDKFEFDMLNLDETADKNYQVFSHHSYNKFQLTSENSLVNYRIYTLEDWLTQNEQKIILK